ncbi:uncharacterized protein LOC126979812 [Leptidea sinapis]|uniref:uncharacterized protein LOC126979812 n=1 Tax=Leptidea sinapis TaxID=189913 RepID=UPI002131A2FF|nr:uncharacterized protein LOC126979812 [Leptidea sinapis]
MKTILVLFSIVGAVYSGPIAQEDSVMRLVVNNFVNCMNSDINLCLKEHALKAAERLGTVRKLNIIDGLTIYNNGPRDSKSFEALSTEPELRNKQITERLWDSAGDLLQKSDLEVSFAGSEEEEEESRSIGDVDEGRGKKKKALKKKLKLLIPLAILAKVKAVALVVLALLVIAASLFKLAVLAKIAFIAKVIAIIKALIAKKYHHEEEHAWVAHEEHGPPVQVPHGGWDGGWSRSRNEANNLAYSAYQQ